MTTANDFAVESSMSDLASMLSTRVHNSERKQLDVEGGPFPWCGERTPEQEGDSRSVCAVRPWCVTGLQSAAEH